MDKHRYSALTGANLDDDDFWITVLPKQPSNITTAIGHSNGNSGWADITANRPPLATTPTQIIVQHLKANRTKSPNETFKKWCKQSLCDLSFSVVGSTWLTCILNSVDVIQDMLLSFPNDNGVGENIQETIHVN